MPTCDKYSGFILCVSITEALIDFKAWFRVKLIHIKGPGLVLHVLPSQEEACAGRPGEALSLASVWLSILTQ